MAAGSRWQVARNVPDEQTGELSEGWRVRHHLVEESPFHHCLRTEEFQVGMDRHVHKYCLLVVGSPSFNIE
jgi:hypothetical protein